MVDDRSNDVKMNDDIETIIARLEATSSENGKILIREAIEKMKNGANYIEALRLTPEVLEVIYQHGYHLFQSGKYKDALSTFEILRGLNPEDQRYAFAIAACHHFAKNYTEAIAYYIIYASFEQGDPIPFYHMYDCFLKTNHPTLAANALDEAYRRAKGNPKYHDLKEKIELELKNTGIDAKGSEININKEIKG
jgi:type III secretion system low calcium response chaperone LcrH/SycD